MSASKTEWVYLKDVLTEDKLFIWKTRGTWATSATKKKKKNKTNKKKSVSRICQFFLDIKIDSFQYCDGFLSNNPILHVYIQTETYYSRWLFLGCIVIHLGVNLSSVHDGPTETVDWEVRWRMIFYDCGSRWKMDHSHLLLKARWTPGGIFHQWKIWSLLQVCW